MAPSESIDVSMSHFNVDLGLCRETIQEMIAKVNKSALDNKDT